MRSAGTLEVYGREPRRPPGWQAPPVDSVTVTRTLVKNLAAAPDGPVSVSGWVDTVRDQKKVQFIVLRDESGAVQLVHPRTDVEEGSEPDAVAATISALTTGTFLTVAGELKHDERVKLGGLEVKIGDARRRGSRPRPADRRRTRASTSVSTTAGSTCAAPR